MKYFGTDGFRGRANQELTVDYALKIGQFMAWYFGRDKSEPVRCVIGKDTRLSSYMIEYSISAGLASAGADAHLMHVTTTPSVSYVTRTENFDFGVMITASHNPYHDNGIKIIDENGYKISEDILEECERYMDGKFSIDFTEIEPGKIVDYLQGRNKYMSYLASTCSEFFRGYRIGLDCANGASSMIAKTVFDMLGAKTYVINNEPNGKNINVNCGSTHMEELKARVVYEKANIGLAFDGDADRLLAVDETGNLVDGDQIMAIVGNHMKAQGKLKGNTIVVTVMTNLGFTLMAKENGIHIEQTKVGDRYVLERMREIDASLGGEQSGHVIFLDENTTGDGLLSALHLLQVMVETGKTLSSLAGIMTVLPQALVNAKVPNHKKDSFMDYPEIADAIAALEEKFKGEGRVLIRPSGTEPKVRVMIEGKDQEEINEDARVLADLIQNTIL